MKTIFISLSIFLSISGLRAQNDTVKIYRIQPTEHENLSLSLDPDQIEPRQLVGTWRLNGENGQLKLKLITPTHFLWVDFNEKDHQVTSSMGGTYSLNRDTYTEHIQFQNGMGNDFTGTDASFKTTVDEKTLHIDGIDNSYNQIWDRQGNANKLDYFQENGSTSQQIVGTWKLDGTGDHVKLKYITPTHYTWVDFPNDDSKVTSVRGGTYSVNDKIYTESIDFQMNQDGNSLGRKYSFEVNVDGDVMKIHGTDNPYNETWRKVYDNSSYIGSSAKKQQKDSGEKKSLKSKIKIFNKKSGHFQGHWAGVDVGLNTYLNKNMSTDLSASDAFMTLDPGKSINFNLNILPVNIGLYRDIVGIQSGLGIEFYNYRFQNNNSIAKDATGVTGEKTFSSINLDKSKLSTTFLAVPLILEVNFPLSKGSSHHMHIAGGVIGGLRLGSHTKVVYHSEGEKHKEKVWGSFNQNYLRYGFTGRIGIDKISLYSTYYPVSLFKTDKGPELYPFNVGISFGMY